MLKNYFLVAVRNLLRNKSYVVINSVGLGISIACCIAAYILVAYNIEFDSFYDDEDVAAIYSIHAHHQEKDGRITRHHTVPYVVPPLAAEEIAGVEGYTRFIGWGGNMRHGSTAFSEGFNFVDSSFFNMFEIPFVKGSAASFADKYTIILNEELAKKYFGEDDPVGKTLIITFANNKELSVTVGGVVGKIPANSTFQFSALLQFEHFLAINDLAADNWGDWRDPSTFVKLVPSAKPEEVGKQLSKYLQRRNEARKEQTVQGYTLEPFKASYSQDDIQSRYANVRISAVPLFIFCLLAAMILLIACFNLTNTSIALTTKRLKEVGVRKSVGAGRRHIILQFLFETTITIVISLFMGLTVSLVLVPAFMEMWNVPYGLSDLSGLNLFLTLVGLVILTSMIAGIYPAVHNSRFKPVSLLKGSSKIKDSSLLSHGLVALQFAVSVIVLIAGVTFIRNTAFQEKVAFGYDARNIITVNIQTPQEYEAMRNALARHPRIEMLASSEHNVGYDNYSFPVGIGADDHECRFMGIGENYFEALGFQVLDGRYFKKDNAIDAEESVIVNQAFVDKFGIKDPLDVQLKVHDKKRHIVGVINNHVDNLFRTKEPEPFLFFPAQAKSIRLLIARAEPEHLAEVQKDIEKTWKGLYPEKPFTSALQEEVLLSELRKTNGNMEKVFLFLTVLGGLLSACGIYAMASLAVARRTKEIGIRKTLGATVSQVLVMMNRHFVVILLIAIVLGSVGGYYLTSFLLDEIYAYHISMSAITISLCAVLIFLIGIGTTSTTIIRSARANPVKTLRTD